jgi:RimJ/RimL family protein N-acetyltransferase
LHISDLISQISLWKRKVYCSIDWAVYSKDNTRLGKANRRAEISHRRIDDIHDLREYSSDDRLAKDLYKIEDHIRSSCSVYLAFFKGDLAGYYNVCRIDQFKHFLHLNHPMFRGSNQYYIFFNRTFDEYQGKGIFTQMLMRISEDILSEPGRVWVTPDARNVASSNALLNAGFERVGHLKYRQIGDYARYNFRDHSPNMGLDDKHSKDYITS